MKLSGEEQKLQALFSEVKAADEQAAPRFATVWNRAQLAPRRMRAFTPAFVGVTALLVSALISLAVWSRYAQRATQQPPLAKDLQAPTTPVTIATTPATTGTPRYVTPSEKPRQTIASRNDKSKTRRTTRLAAANRKLTQDAKTISNWQSPTSALLSSPSDGLFSSVPQFNESTNDLKSFLPNRPK